MKNLLLLPTLFTFVIGFSQTPITNDNFRAAINDCYATHPITGLCVDSEYGPMPNWDVSNVTDMNNAFLFKSGFNGDISSWDVSSVTSMSQMFGSAQAFNQDLNAWNVSNVNDMASMFGGAQAFNQNLNAWDVGNVTNMFAMFSNATSFNGDISSWDVSSVTNMVQMFRLLIILIKILETGMFLLWVKKIILSVMELIV